MSAIYTLNEPAAMSRIEAIDTLRDCESCISVSRIAGPFQELSIKGGVSHEVAVKRASALLMLGSAKPKIAPDGRITVEAAHELATALIVNDIDFLNSSRFVARSLGF